MVIVRVENVTASYPLPQGSDTVSMGLRLREREPDMVGARLSEDMASFQSPSVQLYKSGQIVCTGNRSTAEAREKIGRALTALGLEFDPSKIEIRDIMASSDLGRILNLEKAFLAFGSVAEYNPEWFSGIILKLEDPAVTVVLYSSGKVVLNGARCMDQVYRALDAVFEKLSKERGVERWTRTSI